MNRIFSRLSGNSPAVFIVFVSVAIVIFSPLLSNGFAADDYYVMYRVGVQGDVLAEGFFRPLSDITLYFNYLIGGFNAFNYHFTNILLHGITAFLLYRFCTKISIFDRAKTNRQIPAFIAGLLFVTYPFHSETIAWVVGRASLLAGLLGIASMLIVVSNGLLMIRIFFSCLCFFVGLLAYESIFPLPGIVIVVLWLNGGSRRMIAVWGAAYTLTLTTHFVIRLMLAGVVTGNYGSTIFGLNFSRYLSNVFKITGRLFLPPSDNSIMLVVAFSIGLLALVWLKIRGIKKGILVFEELPVLLMLFLSLIVPFTFSVSTRTTEGDRLLYFPSMFCCMLIAHIVIRYFRGRSQGIIIGIILVYHISFVHLNNMNWRKASEITESFMQQMLLLPAQQQVLLINVPGEYRGAYVFRGALDHALLLRDIDTSNILTVNYVNHGEYMSTESPLHPVQRGDTTVFGPSVHLIGDTLIIKDFREPQNPPARRLISAGDQLWYWDRGQLLLYRN